MRVSVFGLGYVGAITAACLARAGHTVIGNDIKNDKNSLINKGKAPFYEEGLNDLIEEGITSRRLFATDDAEVTIRESDISFICVGTPSNSDGSINLEHIRTVCKDIGNALINKSDYHLIVIRSTIIPGTTETILIPLLEKASGRTFIRDFGVIFNPEFMREGQAISDFMNPERIIIGSCDERSRRLMEDFYQSLGIQAQVIHTGIRAAEMIKYVDNTYHGLKVTFANEIGSICKKLEIDSHEIMNIFLMDKKLNLSPYYFKPGFAFGGSCLPKDIRALIDQINNLRLNCPLIESILPSNEEHINRVVNLIVNQKKTRIGIFGISFKTNTSDVRESATIKLINKLFDIGYRKLFDKQYSIAIYDPNFESFDTQNVPPHIIPLMHASREDVLKKSDILIITHNDPSFRAIPGLMNENQILIDLVRVVEDPSSIAGRYHGLCW
jgi:GDP-mannose 6-dehydrogenase